MDSYLSQFHHQNQSSALPPIFEVLYHPLVPQACSKIFVIPLDTSVESLEKLFIEGAKYQAPKHPDDMGNCFTVSTHSLLMFFLLGFLVLKPGDYLFIRPVNSSEEEDNPSNDILAG